MYSYKDNEAFTALRHHDEYYLSGGDLFFLIEQFHFRVHRYFFERESNYFKAQLATPASPGAPRQGTSESSAIVLENIKADDFAKFLWVFYNPKYSLYKAPVSDWVKILDLAFRWGFQEVKNLVVRELEKLEMTVLDRIFYYHKYEIDRSLLLYRYTALVEREEALTLEESKYLGLETSWRIFTAREIIRAPRDDKGGPGPTPIVIADDAIVPFVREHFEVPEPLSSALEPIPERTNRPSTPRTPAKDISKEKEKAKETETKEQPITAKDQPKSEKKSEKAKKAQAEKDKAEQAKAEKEKAEKEKVEQEKAEKEKAEKEQAEKERLEKEKAEKETAEKEKAEKEKAEKEKAEKEKAEQEKLDKGKSDKTKGAPNGDAQGAKGSTTGGLVPPSQTSRPVPSPLPPHLTAMPVATLLQTPPTTPPQVSSIASLATEMDLGEEIVPPTPRNLLTLLPALVPAHHGAWPIKSKSEQSEQIADDKVDKRAGVDELNDTRGFDTVSSLGDQKHDSFYDTKASSSDPINKGDESSKNPDTTLLAVHPDNLSDAMDDTASNVSTASFFSSTSPTDGTGAPRPFDSQVPNTGSVLGTRTSARSRSASRFPSRTTTPPVASFSTEHQLLRPGSRYDDQPSDASYASAYTSQDEYLTASSAEEDFESLSKSLSGRLARTVPRDEADDWGWDELSPQMDPLTLQEEAIQLSARQSPSVEPAPTLDVPNTSSPGLTTPKDGQPTTPVPPQQVPRAILGSVGAKEGEIAQPTTLLLLLNRRPSVPDKADATPATVEAPSPKPTTPVVAPVQTVADPVKSEEPKRDEGAQKTVTAAAPEPPLEYGKVTKGPKVVPFPKPRKSTDSIPQLPKKEAAATPPASKSPTPEPPQPPVSVSPTSGASKADGPGTEPTTPVAGVEVKSQLPEKGVAASTVSASSTLGASKASGPDPKPTAPVAAPEVKPQLPGKDTPAPTVSVSSPSGASKVSGPDPKPTTPVAAPEVKPQLPEKSVSASTAPEVGASTPKPTIAVVAPSDTTTTTVSNATVNVPSSESPTKAQETASVDPSDTQKETEISDVVEAFKALKVGEKQKESEATTAPEPVSKPTSVAKPTDPLPTPPAGVTEASHPPPPKLTLDTTFAAYPIPPSSTDSRTTALHVQPTAVAVDEPKKGKDSPASMSAAPAPSTQESAKETKTDVAPANAASAAPVVEKAKAEPSPVKLTKDVESKEPTNDTSKAPVPPPKDETKASDSSKPVSVDAPKAPEAKTEDKKPDTTPEIQVTDASKPVPTTNGKADEDPSKGNPANDVKPPASETKTTPPPPASGKPSPTVENGKTAKTDTPKEAGKVVADAQTKKEGPVEDSRSVAPVSDITDTTGKDKKKTSETQPPEAAEDKTVAEKQQQHLAIPASTQASTTTSSPTSFEIVSNSDLQGDKGDASVSSPRKTDAAGQPAVNQDTKTVPAPVAKDVENTSVSSGRLAHGSGAIARTESVTSSAPQTPVTEGPSAGSGLTKKAKQKLKAKAKKVANR